MTSSYEGLGDYKIPDVVGEIIGARAWYIRDGGWLSSINRAYTWLPGNGERFACLTSYGLERHLGVHLDENPSGHCRCGFYALNPDERYGMSFNTHAGIAVGYVGMWGKVVEGSLGYRAEYARILELFVFPSSESAIASIEERYQVPVTMIEKVPDWPDFGEKEEEWISEKQSERSP